LEILHEKDCIDIAWDWEMFSIFFPKPITLEFPEQGVTKTVGSGYGGLSKSLFQRGFDCNLCGRCCRNTHRRIWTWLPSETPHPNHRVVSIIINGQTEWNLAVHVNKNGGVKCDYLTPIPGEFELGVREACSIHDTTQPVHCKTYPGVAVYNVRHGDSRVPLLSRRLPPRNWRWPKCPIPIYELPLARSDIENDLVIWDHWVSSFKSIPGNCVELAFDLYIKTIQQVAEGTPQETNLLFSDFLSR